MFTLNINVNGNRYDKIVAKESLEESLELMVSIGLELSKHIKGFTEVYLLKNGKVLKGNVFERGMNCARIVL